MSVPDPAPIDSTGGVSACALADAWLLQAGDGTVLGRLDLPARDEDGVHCRFCATPAFEAIAHLFAAAQALLNRGELEASEAAYARIDRLELALLPVAGGAALRGMPLHFDGELAWFRHPDSP